MFNFKIVICTLVTVLLSGLPSIAVAQNEEVSFGYSHDYVNCTWLTDRYDEVVKRNDEGYVHVVDWEVVKVRWYSLPFFLLTGDLFSRGEDLLPTVPDLGGKVVLSGNIHDIGKVAQAKNCIELFERYRLALEQGKLTDYRPMPPTSVLVSPSAVLVQR